MQKPRILRNVLLIWGTLSIMGCPDRVGQPGQPTGGTGESETLEIRKDLGGKPPPQPAYDPKKYVLPFNHGEP